MHTQKTKVAIKLSNSSKKKMNLNNHLSDQNVGWYTENGQAVGWYTEGGQSVGWYTEKTKK